MAVPVFDPHKELPSAIVQDFADLQTAQAAVDLATQQLTTDQAALLATQGTISTDQAAVNADIAAVSQAQMVLNAAAQNLIGDLLAAFPATPIPPAPASHKTIRRP